MNTRLFILSTLALLSLQGALVAQKNTLAIGRVKVTPAINTYAEQNNTKLSLDRMVQSLDGQLMNAFQATRKVDILARSDMDALLEEEGLSGQSVDMSGADHLVVVTVDDFQDYVETARFEALGTTATKRIVRFSAVGRIYDAKTSQLIESASFQISNQDARQNLPQSTANGAITDALLGELSRQMAEDVTEHVINIIFPAKVIARTGQQITINRGEGSGIEVGQTWDALAVGEELIDPDTGESLGQNVIPVGTVKISRVLPKITLATVVEDFGITTGAILQKQK